MRSLLICSFCLTILTGIAQDQRVIDNILLELKAPASPESAMTGNLELAHQYLYAQPDSAEFYATVANKIANEINSPSGMALSNWYLGSVWLRKNDLVKAHEAFQQFLSFAIAARDKNLEAHALNQLGRFFLVLADDERAVDQFQKATDIFNDKSSDEGQAVMLESAAQRMELQNKVDTALTIIESALLIRQKLPDKNQLIDVLNVAGRLSIKNKKFKQATDYISQADNIAIALRGRMMQAYQKILLTEVLLESGDIVSAGESLLIYRDSFKYYASVELNERFNILYGEYLWKQGQLVEARKLFLHVAHDSAQIQSLELRERAFANLIKLSLHLNDSLSARQFSDQKKKMSESIRSDELTARLARLDFKFSLERLETQNQELELTNTKAEGALFTVTIIATSILVIAVLYFVLDKQRKRNALANAESERKLMRLIAENERKYRLLSENSKDLICLHRPDGVFTFVSSASLELLGMAPAELEQTNPAALVHPDDIVKIKNVFSEDGKNMVEHKLEVRFRNRLGDHLWVETIVKPLMEDNAISGFQTSSRDITLRKEYESALMAARAKAEDMSRQKSLFVSNMSHEIRTPLNAIIGFTNLLMRRKPREDQTTILATIKSASENLLHIVNDVLDFSKVEAGKMTLEEIRFNLHEACEMTLKLFEEKALGKKIGLSLTYDATLPTHVMGDSTKLKQVLTNLLGNAIKFTSEGSVSLVVTPATHESKIHFAVADSGIGIPADKLETIFESFTQADSSTTRHFGGSGLGLNIAKGMVELMGGSLSVSSEPGKGSTFWFAIPLSAAV